VVLGVQAVLNVKELFDFVTDPETTEEGVDARLDELLLFAETRPEETNEEANERQVAEAVFKGAFIPRDLSEVSSAQ
jgi:hypothetical protein